MITKTQLLITVRMLEMASDTFSNNGCNDFYLENTPENLEFVKSMIAHSDFPTDSPYISHDGKRILTMDTDVMDYCRSVLMTLVRSKSLEEQK